MKFAEMLASIGPPIPGRSRVIVFSDSPLPSLLHGALGRGGGQGATWLSQVAEGFAAATDLDIIWVDFAVGSKQSDMHRLENQTFLRIAHPKHSWDLLLDFHLVRWRIRKLLKTLRPAVIHCWGTERVHSAAIAVAKDCPSILSMQGTISHYAEIGSLPDIWQWKVMAKNEPKTIRAATVVTGESQWVVREVLRIHPTAVTEEVEYGVHPSFYDVQWTPDPAKPVIFYSGSIDWRKGMDVMLDAAALHGPRNWTLAIAGDGDLRPSLEQRGVAGVLWLGNLKWDELRERMSKAWGFVMPTRADSGPTSVKEARVMGLPIIITADCGQAECIREGENGFIVSPLTAEGLRSACDRLTASLDTARAMSASGIQEARDYLQPRNTVNAFLSLYRRLARTA